MEDVIIHSKRYNTKKIFFALFAIGLVVYFILFTFSLAEAFEYRNAHRHTDACFSEDGGVHSCVYMKVFPFVLQAVFDIRNLAVLFVFTIIGLLLSSSVNNVEIVVSDKRVRQTSKVLFIFKRYIEIPIDSITSIHIFGAYISISTPSATIRGYPISNSAVIFDVLSELLIKRQSGK